MIATYSRVQWGKVLMVLAAIATAMGFAISSAAPARATDSSHTIIFWAIPAGGGHTQSTAFNGGPQTFYSYGTWGSPPTPNTALQCGVWYQVDRYHTDTAARSNRLASILSDNHLAAGEDWNGASSATDLFDPWNSTQWTYVYGGDCTTTTSSTTTSTTTSTTSTSTTTTTTTSTTTTPPVDVCSNIDGDQLVVPDGYTLVDGECLVTITSSTTTTTTTTTTTPPVDVCDNLQGVQLVVPEGYTLIDGVCDPLITTTTTTTTTSSTTTTPPVDVCSNLDGDQLVVPEGYTLVDGECLTDVTLDTSSTPTLTEVTLAATGAGGSSGTAAFAVALALGGMGLLLLRRRTSEEI